MFRRLMFLLSLSIPFAPTVSSQDPPRRDPRALAVFQHSLSTMGRLPSDSTATGKADLVEGSTESAGTIRIRIRGLDHASEELLLTDGVRRAIYSRLRAATEDGEGRKPRSLEWAASSDAPLFPARLVARGLTDSDFALEYIGLEKVGAADAHHIRIWNTFSSKPKLKALAEFTEKHIWIDALSGLPLKLYCEERFAGGAVPRVPIEVQYADYRNVGGVLFPFQIKKSLNGSPWATITIQSVTLNSGLRDADFPVQ